MAIHLLCFFCAKWWLLPLLLLDHTLSSSSLPTSWGVWANLGSINTWEKCVYGDSEIKSTRNGKVQLGIEHMNLLGKVTL
uniref:Secreted protein n=1 Tax=Oryza sativa subsp. japonica TaxID=39947 RepID=Q10G14_ORYSJ|nr:hypothetical protein LOC_Os03g44544 [Oryza sativa Japonica Group]